MKTLQVIDALGALAHEHRLAIFRLLVERGPAGLPAGRIAERVGLVPSSLTFHLQNLQRAGLIARRRESRQLRCLTGRHLARTGCEHETDRIDFRLCGGGNRVFRA